MLTPTILKMILGGTSTSLTHSEIVLPCVIAGERNNPKRKARKKSTRCILRVTAINLHRKIICAQILCFPYLKDSDMRITTCRIPHRTIIKGTIVFVNLVLIESRHKDFHVSIDYKVLPIPLVNGFKIRQVRLGHLFLWNHCTARQDQSHPSQCNSTHPTSMTTI